MGRLSFMRANVKLTSHYDNFESIDWMVERSVERLRHQFLKKYVNWANLWTKIKILLDRISGWIIILLLGFTAGTTAKFVTIGVNYLADLREGICVGKYLLNQRQCCWNSRSAHVYPNSYVISCDEWRSWATIFGITSSTPTFVVNYFIYTCYALLYTLFSSCVVVYVAPYAGGGGISEIKTILSGFVMRGYFGIITYITKTISLIPTVASGLVLGQEGPMVHICCCLANIICRINKNYRFNESKHHDIYFAGAASGVAVAFGAPIGGLLFSYEEISSYFHNKTIWKTFICGTIGAITLALLDPLFNGNFILYSIDYTVSWKLFEIIFFILLGILGGLYGALFICLTLKFNKFKTKIPLFKNPILQVVTITFITSLMCYPNYFTRISNHHLLDILFNNCNKGPLINSIECDNIIGYNITNGLPTNVLNGLTVSFFFKASLMIVTYGLSVPTGLLVPSLTIGACVGKILGILVDYATMKHPNFVLFSACKMSDSSCILSGTYSVLGAAAFLAGTSHMTVALIIIMVELTGQITFIIPLMIVVIIAKLISHSLHESLYDADIKRKQYPFLFPSETILLNEVAENFIKPNNQDDEFLSTSNNSCNDENIQLPQNNETTSHRLIVLPLTGLTLQELEYILEDYQYSGYPVVNNYQEKYLHGYVTRKDILTALNSDNETPSSMLLNTVKIHFVESKFAHSVQGGTITDIINLNHIVNHSPVVVSKYASIDMIQMLFIQLGNRFVCIVDKGYIQLFQSNH